MPHLPLILQWIQTHPGLFAATAGLALVSSYLLLLLATRLGDIKPGVQTFVLSGVIHVVMATFWGTLAVPLGPGSPMGTKRAALETTPIREVIVEDSNGEPAEGSAEGADRVWEALPTSQSDPFVRAGSPAETDTPVPSETPERSQGTAGPTERTLPALPKAVEVAMAAPRPVETAQPAPRAAAEQAIDIGEDTAEAREGVKVGGSPIVRGATQPGGTSSVPSEEPVEREAGTAGTPTGNVNVKVAAQPNMSGDLIGDDGPQRQQTESQLTRKAAGPAKSDIEMEEPLGTGGGGTEGTGTGTPGAGTPGPSKFARTGGGTGTGSAVRGSFERTRTTGRSSIGTGGVGGTGGGPTIAALSPEGLREGGMIGERPGISRPNFGAIQERGSVKMSDTYRLRNLPQRKKMAVRLGATQDSERAVEISLRWLALHQNLEGYWDADGFDANCPSTDRCWGRGGRGSATETEKINNPTDRLALQQAGQQADTGLTALVLLTFLGAGYTHEEGQYSDQIDRAIRWMIRQQTSNGFLGGKASHYERMYCHGMATYALGEACGMMADPESDPQLRRALAKAVGYIIAMQNPNDGGWRYLDGNLPRQEGDMSMFGWQLMALKSSQIAGIEVPEETQAGMVKFLKRISLGERRGLASYRFGEGPKASMTAEALFSRQMLGMKRDNPSSLEAVEFLTKHPPRQTEQDLYYWYYGTLAMYQYGGEPWRKWNDQLRDTLVATQRTTGHAAGSWDPRDNWSLHGGRLYSTALSTLCLEVYYRFLPLYQLNDSRIEDMTN